MSLTPSRHLPERPSLEQLRKQAREHLDTLRAADPAVKLAAAQHALAREYGFESWPKLVHHAESLPPASRMLRPAALQSDEKLLWSPGRGTDLWALIQACISGDLDAVRALIARDRSLARAHYTYRKPLYFAIRENRVDIARFLLEHDHNPMDLWFDDSPLEIARDRGYVEMERLLTETLDTTFNASSKGESIARALREHDLPRMRDLLDAEPALLSKGDGRSSQPIHWATMTRQLEAIDELLQRGADIDARRMDGAQPIHLTNGDYFYRGWRDVPRDWPTTAAQVMAHLRSRGAIVDLPTACHTGDLDRVRELLGQDPSLANRLGGYEGYYLGAGAPLANAAAAGRLDIVQLLLDHGADPSLPEEQIAPRGKALYVAVYNGYYEIAKLLLERGAFPNPPVESSGRARTAARCAHGAAASLLRRDADARECRRGVAGSRAQLAAHHAAPRSGPHRRPREGEGARRRGCRSDRARRAPSVHAARVGGEVRTTRDGHAAARARCAAQSGGRSGVGDAARLGEEARARGDRPPVAAIAHVGRNLRADTTLPDRRLFLRAMVSSVALSGWRTAASAEQPRERDVREGGIAVRHLGRNRGPDGANRHDIAERLYPTRVGWAEEGSVQTVAGTWGQPRAAERAKGAVDGLPPPTIEVGTPMTFNYQDRIERNPRVAGGEAVIKGTRVTLRTVLASLAEGATTDEILNDFPTLTEADVRAAIAFAAASAQEDLPFIEAHVR